MSSFAPDDYSQNKSDQFRPSAQKLILTESEQDEEVEQSAFGSVPNSSWAGD